MSWLLNKLREHPVGFYFIFWGELAERASFYGMKCLLALYMVEALGFTEEKSGPVVHLFTAACYLAPLLGGYVADHYLGKFKTIIYFAVPYIGGHLILGTWSTELALYIALVLLAGGSGTIKPNISPLMGQMYDEAGKSPELRAKAFTWFYAAINIGAASSMTTLPLVRDRWGYSTAFIFPTVLMAISLIIFYIGKRHYPQGEVHFTPSAQPALTAEEKREGRRVLLNLAGIFSMIVFFWAIFDQASSTWVFFAKDYMELYGLAPDMMQGLNPILIVGMIPLFNFGWDRLAKAGYGFTPIRKMLLGFLLTAFCMGVMSYAGFAAESGKVSVLWQAGAYIIVTAAELCISVVGLEFAYAAAPTRMKGMITGVFLFTVFIGNLLAGYLSSLYAQMSPGNYFGLLAIMMLTVAAVFFVVMRRYEARNQIAAK